MDLIPPDGLELVLRHIPGPALKPVEIIQAVFHLNDQTATGARILKTMQVRHQGKEEEHAQ